MLLTVLIPTTGRLDTLKQTLRSLESSFRGDMWAGKYRILISNSGTTEIKIEFPDSPEFQDAIRLRTAKQFWNSAEEHIADALESVHSEYVWLLGDDDIALQDGVSKLYEILDSKAAELIFLQLLNWTWMVRFRVTITSTF